MSVYGVVINLVLPSANGNFDVTDPLITSEPKLVMATLTDGAILGTEDPDIRNSWGAADGNVQHCVVVEAMDGGASADVERVQKGALAQRTPTTAAGADTVTLVTFLSNGVRLNLANFSGAGKRLTITVIGGSQVTAAEVLVADLTTGSGVGQTFPWLNTSLDVNLMFFQTAGTTEADGVGSFAIPCLGAGIKVDGSITQRNINVRIDQDGAASGNPGMTYRNDRVSGSMQASSDTVQWGAQWTDSSPGDFELTPSITTPNDEIVCIGVQLEDVNLDLQSITMPTSTGDFDVVSGFRSEIAIGAFSMLQAFNSAAFDSSSGVTCTSVVNRHGQMFSHALRNEDAAPTINCGSTVANSAIHCPWHSSSTIPAGASSTGGFSTGSNPVVFLKDRITYDFDAVNTGTRLAWVLQIGPKNIPLFRLRHEEDSFQGV